LSCACAGTLIRSAVTTVRTVQNIVLILLFPNGAVHS
jgi:hypothetical protein